MDIFEAVRKLSERPGMFLPKNDFYNNCSFLNGLNHASGSQLLSGFAEWLSEKAPSETKNYWWPQQILSQVAPDGNYLAWDNDESVQAEATRALFNQLDIFLKERASGN